MMQPHNGVIAGQRGTAFWCGAAFVEKTGQELQW
jgi:hypothetical protein